MINVHENLALGALVDNVVIAADSDAFTNRFFLISADLEWAMRDHTGGEGPLKVGIAHGDYTVTEIQENLALTGMEDDGDKIAQEQGRRLVRSSGQFSGLSSDEALNDGMAIRTTAKFVIQDGQTVKFYTWNRSGATLTTGTAISITGKLYGKWL